MTNRHRARRAGVAAAVLVWGLAVPAGAVAQQRGRDVAKSARRPPLQARVVSSDGAGVPVVVTAEGDRGNAATSAGSRVSVRVPTRSTVPRAENWLVGAPRESSWLPQSAPNGAVSRSISGAGVQSGPAQLRGVQEYLRDAGDTAASVGVGSKPPPARRQPLRAAMAPPAAPGATAGPASDRPGAGAIEAYVLGPGDKLDIYVWRNPELSRSVPVRPDGLISLPLAGEMQAAGKTVSALNAEITAVLEDYIQYPTVTVTVTEVRSMVIYVNGRVAQPGTLVLDRPINVIQAIAMAGGVQEFADRNGVVVIRTVNGRRVRIPFRYDDAVKGKGNTAEFVLQAGDVVYVP